VLEVVKMIKSEMVHIGGACTKGVLFLVKDKRKRQTQDKVRVTSSEYSSLNGVTRGYREYMRIPSGINVKEKVKPRLTLQTSMYETSPLKKVNGELVFNEFRAFDDKALEYYNEKQAQIKALQAELNNYLTQRFLELPLLKFNDVVNIEIFTERQKAVVSSILQQKFKGAV